MEHWWAFPHVYHDVVSLWEDEPANNKEAYR